MPVILATRGKEIRRIVVRSLPEQIVQETLSQKNPTQKHKKEWWSGSSGTVSACISSVPASALSSNPSTDKKKR
jgi:hypothetical protein